MESKARFVGHSIHTMLVAFPLGLLVSSVAVDFFATVLHRPNGFHVAYWMIAGGIIGGLVAAVFGLIDFLAVPGKTRARRVGMFHAVGNLVVLFFFGLSWFMRSVNPYDPPLAALVASYFSLLLLVFTAWAGGELVERLGVGVYDNANVNAPTSWSLFRRDKTPTLKI